MKYVLFLAALFFKKKDGIKGEHPCCVDNLIMVYNIEVHAPKYFRVYYKSVIFSSQIFTALKDSLSALKRIINTRTLITGESNQHSRECRHYKQAKLVETESLNASKPSSTDVVD